MITYATTDKTSELQGIYALQKVNLKKNLSKQEIESDGFVTVDHDWKTLEKLNAIEPHVIVKDDNEVVGYVLAMTKASRFDLPIIFPMFEEFEKMSYKGKAVSTYDYMVVGQACIHKNYRGKGLIENCFRVYKEAFAERYDFSITEIAASNQRSIKAHQKVGFKEVHSYTDPDKNEWVVVIWDWKN